MSECESSDNEVESRSVGRGLKPEAFSAQKKNEIRKEVESKRAQRKSSEKSTTSERYIFKLLRSK